MTRLFVLLIPALFLLACGGGEPDEPSQTTSAEETIPFDREGELTFMNAADLETKIAIEIADTDSARTRGLMQRTSLPDQSGMLFIFPDEQPRSFWMSNTPLPLDLIFVSSDSQVVHIAKYARPFSSEQILSGGEAAQYVVEVPAGFADLHGLAPGDRVHWRRDADS